ncbi:MAG: helix-turn-helix transcriptional regulator [Akkermansiaceae bacterium]
MLENLKIGPRYDGFLFLAEAARNPPVLKPHRHLELELNVVVRGSITYVVGDRRFTFGKRTLLWMFPAQEHQLVDRSGDAQYYVAVFKPAVISQAAGGAGYEGLRRENNESGGVLNTLLEPATFDLIRRTMEVTVADGLHPDVLNREAGFGASSNFAFEHGDPDALNAALRHLLLLCWRYQRGRLTPDGAVVLHPAVRQALSLLGEGVWDDDLASLAKRCGVSEVYLSRVFARQVGVPLNRYRNSVRLGRFLDLLRAGDGRTLTELAYEAGFGSYAQFFKIYVQAYGQGPRETGSLST